MVGKKIGARRQGRGLESGQASKALQSFGSSSPGSPHWVYAAGVHSGTILTLLFPSRLAVPVDFSQMLRHYTTDGFRVLGLACKPLSMVTTFEEALQLPRDSVESSLTFLGFLVMKNVLKPESAPVIHLLRNANIRPVMVTGDPAVGSGDASLGDETGQG